MKHFYGNQYKRKYQKRSYVAASILLIVLSFLAVRAVARANHVDFQLKAYAPTLPKAYAQALPTPTPTPTEHDLIVAYIKQVFGSQSDNAFKILSCENHALNPLAQGHNTNGTTDTGIFQINSIWGNPEILKDWKVNIEVAHAIFNRGGWNEWACEYKYHVLEK